MNDQTINCRVRDSQNCHHGRPENEVFKTYPLQEDATFDPDDGSVVCDPCYVSLGQPRFKTVPELNARLAKAGKLRRG